MIEYCVNLKACEYSGDIYPSAAERYFGNVCEFFLTLKEAQEYIKSFKDFEQVYLEITKFDVSGDSKRGLKLKRIYDQEVPMTQQQLNQLRFAVDNLADLVRETDDTDLSLIFDDLYGYWIKKSEFFSAD